jgi:hypothetical protein
MADLDDALDGLSRRELEALVAKATTRLASCTLCGADGAFACRVFARVSGRQQDFALMLCAACIERQRLPESRAAA